MDNMTDVTVFYAMFLKWRELISISSAQLIHNKCGVRNWIIFIVESATKTQNLRRYDVVECFFSSQLNEPYLTWAK